MSRRDCRPQLGRSTPALARTALPSRCWSRSVATRRRVFGSDHPQTLFAINELANLYWFLDRFADAEPLFLEVVERSTRVLGEEDAATLRARFDLASLYARQGKWTDAEQLQRPTLAIQQRTLGHEHPDTLASLGNLAAFLNGQQRYQEAAVLLTEVIDGRRRVLGADHPSTIVSLGNLAYSYEMLEDFARAEPIYREAIALHTPRERRQSPENLTRSRPIWLVDVREAESIFRGGAASAEEPMRGIREAFGAGNENTVGASQGFSFGFTRRWDRPATARALAQDSCRSQHRPADGEADQRSQASELSRLDRSVSRMVPGSMLARRAACTVCRMKSRNLFISAVIDW